LGRPTDCLVSQSAAVSPCRIRAGWHRGIHAGAQPKLRVDARKPAAPAQPLHFARDHAGARRTVARSAAAPTNSTPKQRFISRC
jgi:hypothetical protein